MGNLCGDYFFPLIKAYMKYIRTKLLEPAVTKFPRLETVMIESTYGGKDNVLPPRKDCEEQLINIVKRTIDRKGKF